MLLKYFIPGEPKPQPRVRATIRGNRPGVWTPKSADAWKASIMTAWLMTPRPQIKGPVFLSLTFVMPRPKSNKSKFHTVRPDLDNLAKAAMDALTDAGAWRDDSQVCSLNLVKIYADELPTGAYINIETPEESYERLLPSGG